MSSLYDVDFYAWTSEQAEVLRKAAHGGSNEPLDFENLAEEIESLGKSDKRALKSEISRIIHHLVKLQYSPVSDPRGGWYRTIDEAREQIERILEDSPSLRAEVSLLADAEMGRAKRAAIRDLERRNELQPGMRRAIERARFTEDQITGDWFPKEPEAR